MLMNTQSFKDFEAGHELTKKEKQNIILIETIKKYSVDSLFYKPTKNFTQIYDQGQSPLLWVVTASQKFKIEIVQCRTVRCRKVNSGRLILEMLTHLNRSKSPASRRHS